MSVASCRQLSPAPSSSKPVTSAVNPGGLLELQEDLQQLEAEGLVVSFMDGEGVIRYRAIRKAA